MLPRLLTGESVRLVDEPDQPVVELAPAVPVPPFWVGNASPVAVRRAAGSGDGWFPSLVPVDEVATGSTRLAELAAAYGRPTPTIAIGATGVLGGGDVPSRAEIAARLRDAYGISATRAGTIPLTGGPAEFANRLVAYRDAGARHLVMGFAGGDWRRQCELLAEASTLVR